MNKNFFCKLAAVIFTLSIFFSAKVSAEGIWRLDGTLESSLPRNFRAVDNLRISGSGQPAASSLLKLKEYLAEKMTADGKIYIVDLREESHGFANGFPVSYYENKNLANFFKRRDEIETVEIEQLTDMLDKKIKFVPLGNEDKKLFKPLNVKVKNVETERQKVSELKMEYVRFSTTDMYFPMPEVVDEFILFVANLNENDWLHFHCQAGHGRTSTFMIMYDILKHPEKSLWNIAGEQELLGGSDVVNLREDKGDHDYYIEAHNLRANNLIKFFHYVRGVQNEEIGLQWSEYLKLNK